MPSSACKKKEQALHVTLDIIHADIAEIGSHVRLMIDFAISDLHELRTELHDRHFFFFNDTATTEIYTLSLHDALPILSSLMKVKDIPFAEMKLDRVFVTDRSEEHTSELQSRQYLVCRLLLEKQKKHRGRGAPWGTGRRLCRRDAIQCLRRTRPDQTRWSR